MDPRKTNKQSVDELLGFIDMIRRRLTGDAFSTLAAKMYALETFEPAPCPECGKDRQKFFLLLQPGEDLFDNTGVEKVISNYKIFCLECTRKVNVIPKDHASGGKDDAGGA